MSLVDYAHSSDEDDAENPPEVEEEKISEEEEDDDDKENRQEPNPPPRGSTPTVNSHSQSSLASSHQQSANGSRSSPSVMRLPDASLLLGSPSVLSHQVSGGDHSSRVAAAMAESASRKRESNGLGPHPLSKHPRGNLRHSRNVPDTLGGRLAPPQLNGRSNVVTEDIGKLFVNRQTDGSH